MTDTNRGRVQSTKISFFQKQGSDKVISFVQIAGDNYKLAMIEIYNLEL